MSVLLFRERIRVRSLCDRVGLYYTLKIQNSVSCFSSSHARDGGKERPGHVCKFSLFAGVVPNSRVYTGDLPSSLKRVKQDTPIPFKGRVVGHQIPSGPPRQSTILVHLSQLSAITSILFYRKGGVNHTFLYNFFPCALGVAECVASSALRRSREGRGDPIGGRGPVRLGPGARSYV